MYTNTTGSSNTASGNQSLYGNTAGILTRRPARMPCFPTRQEAYNLAAGAYALYSNTTGSQNTAVGYQALRGNTTGNFNTSTGFGSLNVNTTGINNTATGAYALYLNTTGSSNVANGTWALRSNTTGAQNTAVGYQALNGNTTGNFNTSTGFGSLNVNTTGGNNTAAGAFALYLNTTGIQNTGGGAQSLNKNTTGSNNTAGGFQSLYANTIGIGNAAFGVASLSGNTIGSYNIGLGVNAGKNLTTGSYNIAIGHLGVAAEARTIRIGAPGSQTRAFVAGIRGIKTGAATAVPVVIDSNGQLGTISSSRRYKEDIADMAGASDRLQSLHPVTFRYRKAYANGEKPVQYGLIAEEVAEVFPELAVLNEEGEPETVKYQDLVPLLLNEVQKQRKEISEQTKLIESLNQRLQTLERQPSLTK